MKPKLLITIYVIGLIVTFGAILGAALWYLIFQGFSAFSIWLRQ